jgi:hypothetical protein
MEVNKWYREGLYPETQFSDDGDMFQEKLTDNRSALVYYDMSQDQANSFRKILMETFPGNSYFVIGEDAGKGGNPKPTDVYPPSAGVTKVYADAKETVGWNVHGITPNAKNPQRIFDFLSYMLTWQGSVEGMYGPEGDYWNGMDANRTPNLAYPESQMTKAETDRLGYWKWTFCNLADPIDMCKFAVNRAAPADQKDWVITMQSDVLSPIMFCTDEMVNFNVMIDPLSDLGISKDSMWRNEIEVRMPLVMTAASADEASKLYDELLAILEAGGLKEIEDIYDAKWRDTVATQGFTSYEGR